MSRELENILSIYDEEIVDAVKSGHARSRSHASILAEILADRLRPRLLETPGSNSELSDGQKTVLGYIRFLDEVDYLEDQAAALSHSPSETAFVKTIESKKASERTKGEKVRLKQARTVRIMAVSPSRALQLLLLEKLRSDKQSVARLKRTGIVIKNPSDILSPQVMSLLEPQTRGAAQAVADFGRILEKIS
jgi:hypothetical protein